MSFCCRDISLKLAGSKVLEQVDVHLEPGKIVAILGPNGAGKSSLIRVLGGEWVADRGRVELNKIPIADWSNLHIAQTLAVMAQQSNLTFAFNCEEVVMLGRTPHATGQQLDIEITHQALACVDATYLADRLYTELSGGEKQRVQLARILAQIWAPSVHGPRYLLLDEPTASFDLAHQHMMLGILRRFASNGVGALVVLHDLNLAAQIADTMVLMKKGRVVISDNPHNVMQAAVISEVFDVGVSIVRHPRHGIPMAML